MYGVGSVRQWYNAHTKFSENRQLVQKFKRGTHSKCISWWSKDSFFFLVARKAGQRSRIAYEARRRHRSRFVIKFSIISKCEFTTCMTLSKTRSHNCHKRHVCIDTLILLRVPPMLTATSGKLQIQGVGYIKWQDCSLLFAGNATYQKTMAYNEYRDQFQSKIFLVLWKVLMLCFLFFLKSVTLEFDNFIFLSVPQAENYLWSAVTHTGLSYNWIMELKRSSPASTAVIKIIIHCMNKIFYPHLRLVLPKWTLRKVSLPYSEVNILRSPLLRDAKQRRLAVS